MSQPSEENIEEIAQQLILQLNELRNAIQLVQGRSLAISSELQEIRLAYETLSTIRKFSQSNVLASLDRQGYVFVKMHLAESDRAIVRISRDLYALLPIENAMNILSMYEKDLISELRETEAELKKLNELYEQLQKKLQEYLAILSQKERTTKK
ncbi:hypothetical protein Igag_1414 [Ignisphaera aggregans DSM 17230]|uniref:Prefoldin subunit alpha n=1 Tax=Ignisphaera aggregans (strain DSM 17230 / JCM 13409 / AQ1.S1) TaxID=583356 RepID=E0SQG1_IGNAA|nr:hypothetical protein Igag_1414 [Ignisphaera aggregans DSM 17230]